MYEWIIIGGGIHGCTVAAHLIKSGVCGPEDLLILDPHHQPLHKWKQQTKQIGMTYLRSPSVHHIAPDPFSLQHYAKKTNSEDFYGPYKRPSLALFNDHCDQIIAETGISSRFQTATVAGLDKTTNGWNIRTESNNTFSAAHTVIATGMGDHLAYPAWSEPFLHQENNMYHALDEHAPDASGLSPAVMIVGGGITAAHLSLKLSRLYPGQTTLVTRHPFRVHKFDSDPGWLGPKYLTRFAAIKNYQKRREQIQQERNRGSVTNELLVKVRKAVREEKLQHIQDDVVSAEHIRNQFYLQMNSKQTVTGKTLLLATGYQALRPKPAWLNKLFQDERLTCAACGNPILTPSLEWDHQLYVTGPLAELEIGPVARNIAGARKAAERIVKKAQKSPVLQ
ncbi:FAD/NAD(P)-binding protein [Salisediminibacterium halotolerans]|uniref:L-lysine 6-monooxygenase (NADPH-requiring) n=1 Tax=Salisediminibacterium halotolerans TaxID=517425 RepID=A0A1H9R9X9_9BACI|nr:FAD/NAD(P)-binding protein [Salisediminibacterium haloalkalitolerans]SER69345.1 L-lysine 6-monooxygenase (NADPH-requiring) [Salisediminibacterium haloalkalitolerans]